MTAPKKTTDPIRIEKSRDGDSSVILHPADNDLFVRTGKQVIASCQLSIGLEVWLDELAAMGRRVHEWCHERRDRVRACYCAPRGPRIVYFFMPPADCFDFAMAEALADLGMELDAGFNVGTVELHQVPWKESGRFVDPSSAKLIYGEPI